VAIRKRCGVSFVEKIGDLNRMELTCLG
jgi:hypothetical protein